MPAAGSSNLERSARVRAVVDDVISRRCAGRAISDDAVVLSHPDLMPELADELRALRMIDGARFVAQATQVIGPAAVEDNTIPQRHAAGVGDPDRDGRRPGLPTDAFPGYELLRELHRGGQGVVYLAIQKTTRRKVAIKVMLEGPFAGARDRVRFEREVQILGSLNHPNIVAVHDSGTAPSGSFYYVMDYISGVPLDEYVRDKFHSAASGSDLRFPISDFRFPIGRRGSSASGLRIGNRKSEIDNLLVLFSRICEAVNAAHLRGVIHRDLKPGNIRIDSNGEPHVLDFGLAKIAMGDVALAGIGNPSGSDADDREGLGRAAPGRAMMMTTTGQFVGSLPWASPEQAEGRMEHIDVRTDVYSLGVILYQMLTDRFPYPVIGNMREVLDHIVRTEPTRPSTIQRLVNDEVETIVLKCLAKERERRYQTAGEIARDVGHYLAGEPINAKRDSTWYVLKKSMRRYKLPVAIAAMFVMLVIGSTIWLSVLYGSQSRLLVQVRQMHGFLQGMLDNLRPSGKLSTEKVVKKMLDNRKQHLQEFKNEPEVMAAGLESIGKLYREWGEYAEAEEQLAQALEIRSEILPDPHPDLASSLFELARAYFWNGRYREAAQLYQRALAMQQQLHPDEPTHADIARAMTHIAACRLRLGEWSGALDFNQKVLEIRTAAAQGSRTRELAQAQNNLAKVYLDVEDYEQARPLSEAVRAEVKDPTDDDPEIPRAMYNIASCQIGKREFAAADQMLATALDLSRYFGDKHPFVAEGHHGKAELRMAEAQQFEAEWRQSDADAKWLDAETECQAALKIRRQPPLRPDHPDVGDSLSLLGRIMLATDRGAQAEQILREAWEIRDEAVPNHWRTAETKSVLAKCLLDNGQFASAEVLLPSAFEGLLEKRGDCDQTRRALDDLEDLYEALGKPDEAVKYRAKLHPKRE